MSLHPHSPPPISHTRAWIELAIGIAVIITGMVITGTTFGHAEMSGTEYIAGFGPIVLGVGIVMHALSDLAGYRSFVAWRYLLVAPPRVKGITQALLLVAGAMMCVLALVSPGSLLLLLTHPWNPIGALFIVAGGGFLVVLVTQVLRYSRPALWLFAIGLGFGVAAFVTMQLVLTRSLPFVSSLPLDQQKTIAFVANVTGIVMLALAALAAFFGTLRAFFTFFTTVPIGGVWIGTAALVIVLAVMSGFESDLREKILGSNAHIQITKEDGEFVDWRPVKDRIDHIPGIVASTPFAVSEVVVAAHNNGMNVIIKGIDPATVAKVTDLVADLETKDGLQNLEPLIADPHERVVPQTPHDKNATDPAPDDLPTAADPIDFSGAPDAPKPDAPKPDATKPDATKPDATKPDAYRGTDTSDDRELPPGIIAEPFGGDARPLQRAGDLPVDLPPDDLVTSDEPPADYSGHAPPPDHGDPDTMPINVVDFPESTVSKRTQSLPGVLVGRELVKQTHLYVGEEVRVVSPLSDPSNPDATGTPIPFNRDYRVAGTFFTGMYEYDLKYVYVTLESLQDFLDRGDAIDGIEVRIGDPDDTGRFVELLGKELGPGYRIVDWRELNRSLFSALKLEKIAMFLVLGIVILVASFSIVGNLIMVVVEKGREIALLKTLGASNFGVMQLFAIQGLLIGMIGTALGIATGLVACWAGRTFGLPLNPDVYYIDKLPIHVDPQSVAAAAAAGILISMAATLYPALLAARVRPAAGMRH